MPFTLVHVPTAVLSNACLVRVRRDVSEHRIMFEPLRTSEPRLTRSLSRKAI